MAFWFKKEENSERGPSPETPPLETEIKDKAAPPIKAEVKASGPKQGEEPVPKGSSGQKRKVKQNRQNHSRAIGIERQAEKKLEEWFRRQSIVLVLEIILLCMTIIAVIALTAYITGILADIVKLLGAPASTRHGSLPMLKYCLEIQSVLYR